jgi:hypothetical protein
MTKINESIGVTAEEIEELIKDIQKEQERYKRILEEREKQLIRNIKKGILWTIFLIILSFSLFKSF